MSCPNRIQIASCTDTFFFPGIFSTNKKHLEAQKNFGEAQACANSYDYQGAINCLDKAILLVPDDASCLDLRGQCRSVLGDKRHAIEDFDKAIQAAPDWPTPYLKRGNCRMSIDDNKGAMEDYDQAIKLKPEVQEYYYLRGRLKLKLKDYDGARQDFQEALRIDSSFALAQQELHSLSSKRTRTK